MTTRAAVIVDTPQGVVITWAGLADGDDGVPVLVQGYGEMTLQVKGDGTSAALQGSNDGGTTFGALGSGVSANVSSNPVQRVTMVPQMIKPVMTGGSASTVMVAASKQYY